MWSKMHLCSAIALVLYVSPLPTKTETIRVTIDKLAFSPMRVEAKISNTIEWVNKDIVAHTATVKGGWDIMLPPGKSATLVLQAPQAIEYYCRFHPNMKKQIIVGP